MCYDTGYGELRTGQHIEMNLSAVSVSAPTDLLLKGGDHGMIC